MAITTTTASVDTTRQTLPLWLVIENVLPMQGSVPTWAGGVKQETRPCHPRTRTQRCQLRRAGITPGQHQPGGQPATLPLLRRLIVFR